MLTSEEIARGKTEARCTEERLHEHDDCIRFAYEWLDAQTKLNAPNKRKTRPIKHIIERWAGRYVSTSDVEVAAHMHPDISGEYPHFNISSRLVRPNQRRLTGLGQAHTQGYKEDDARRTYASEEP
ncbi:MAG: hypothetical protein ABS75_07950 [Pelagibacterium sp. SCN 63-23]|nr:MAG: hypothetical protein ABS75_07950 [Pelagibacterium sp. SCN 63-23]